MANWGPPGNIPVPPRLSEQYDRPMEFDTSGWSGEGEFTKGLIDALRAIESVDAVKVEDAPASRADAGFSFISNEVFVRFETAERIVRRRQFGFIPRSLKVH